MSKHRNPQRPRPSLLAVALAGCLALSAPVAFAQSTSATREVKPVARLVAETWPSLAGPAACRRAPIGSTSARAGSPARVR